VKLRYVLAAIVLALCVLPAAALPCLSGWSQYSDAMVVCDPNGNVFDFAVATEAQEIGGTSVFLLLVAGPNPAQFGNATTLCEPGIPACGAGLPATSYSDIYGVYANGNGQFFLAFNSDDETSGAAFGGEGAIFGFEVPGTWENATNYLDPALVAQGYTAWFMSDGVPEPASILLIGSGVALIARKLRKR